jgi:hypothetical protein
MDEVLDILKEVSLILVLHNLRGKEHDPISHEVVFG